MKRFFFSAIILCLSLAFMGFTVQTGETAAKKGTTLTVATFNIDAKAHPDLKAQRALLVAHHVEIAGLQEVDRKTERNPLDMPSKFQVKPYKDVYFSKAIDFEGGEYGICLVSQYKFLEKSAAMLDSADAEEQRIYERVVVEKEGKKIAVYNTHLSWETEKIRNKQLNDLMAIVDKDPVKYKIIVGDLNVDQHHKELNMFKTDYRLSNGKDGAWYDTYNGEDPAMKVMSVDNIITSKNIEIQQVKMIETDLSDHNLLVSTLKLL